MRRKPLSRRTLLKGAGGVGIALPLLEAMLDGKSHAQSSALAPKRYFVFFGGISLGADGDARPNELTPNTTGANYDLKSGLAPLATYGVRENVSVLSGLRIPDGDPCPPGGRCGGAGRYHTSMLSPILTGVRAIYVKGNGDPVAPIARGESTDHIVARAIAGSTKVPNLPLRVQVAVYPDGGEGPDGRECMSFRRDANGTFPKVQPIVSPSQAFKTLFGGFVPPSSAPPAPSDDFELRSRRSVLDVVKQQADAMSRRLGKWDQQRLSRHLEEIRDLEKRVAAIGPTPAEPTSSACALPPAPGSDPGNSESHWSGEEDRYRAMCDLIHMAFACDLTRCGTLMVTMFESFLSLRPITGRSGSIHGVGHGSKSVFEVGKVIAWHVKHYASLVAKLRDTPEGNGRLLDNVALPFLFEGGYEGTVHSTVNMAMLVAGGAGGLRRGVHIAAPGKHPAQGLLTCMNAVGLNLTSLGDVSGEIPGLRTS